MSIPEKFSGVLTPVITPIKKDLSPDAKMLIHQCKWMLSQHVGLAVFGTNSEANSLSTGEKIELLDQLIESGINPARMCSGDSAAPAAASCSGTRRTKTRFPCRWARLPLRPA